MKTINILLILSFLFCSQGMMAQRTYLDSSFGVNGIATVTSEVVCNNVLSDDAGNIFIVGYPVSSTKNWESISTCVVTKIKANGELDKTFGENGVARVEVGMPIKYSSDLLITIQSNGKVVVGGINQGTPKKVYVVRFLANGQLDDSFGNNGLFIYDYGQEYLTGDTYSGFSITSLPDESILVGGTARVIKEGKAFPYRSIVKVRPDGTLDEDFFHSDVSDLSLYFDLPIYGFYKFLHLSDGHILGVVLLGHPVYLTWIDEDTMRNKRNAYFKMDYDGNLDTSFGDNGVWIGDYTISDGSTIIAFEQSDGKIIAGPEPDKGYIRLHPDGTLDESYNENLAGFSSILNESGELFTMRWDENKYPDFNIFRLNDKGILQYTIGASVPIPYYHARFLDETALYTVGIDKDASTEDSNDIRIAKLLIDPNTTEMPNVKTNTKLLISQENGALLVKSETAMQDMELIDMSGRVISKQNAGGQVNVSIPTIGLNTGVYLIKAKMMNKTWEIRKITIK